MPRDLDEKRQAEMKRQHAIEEAVQAADRIIMEASDGSNEETNYLTGMVALQFVRKAVHPHDARLLAKDMGASWAG